MKWLDKNIEWIVALAVVFITTITVCEQFVIIIEPSYKLLFSIMRFLLVSLMLTYQYFHFGIRIKKGFLCFFLFYSFFILFYITIHQVYPLRLLHQAPSSVENFVYRTFFIFLFILCSDTIIKYLSIKKYLIISFLLGVLPTLIYVQYVGIVFIQTYGNEDNRNFIGQLTLAYSCVPVLIIAILNLSKPLKNELLYRLFAVFLIFCTGYILLISTKRGPLLWAFVNLGICFFCIKKNSLKFVLLFLIICVFLITNVEMIIDWIGEFAPTSAERISTTIFEGDTAHRFDVQDKSGSGYFIGFNQFAKSPIWGSYFRLITIGFFQGHYPHNIFIEILITMGLVGFLPFVMLLFNAVSNIWRVLRHKHSEGELVCIVLFLASFFELQTTNSLLLNVPFWLFFYIVNQMTAQYRLRSRLQFWK